MPAAVASDLQYQNPVWPQTFADPAVLKHAGGYVAFGTGPAEPGLDGEERRIPVLISDDLVHWRTAPGAIASLPAEMGDEYWAPEAAEHDSRFYLYFSVGAGDRGHAIQVAVAEDAAGPYRHLGQVTPESFGFAIDGHPFRDRDGEWYLFFAADVLTGDRPGTCIWVDRLIDMTRLAGEAKPILRANADWQIYERNRLIYDGNRYDWHTLEGPFVLDKSDEGGALTMLFSGGNWTNATYGVDFATAEHPMGPWHLDNVSEPRVLKTLPGRVEGPGHNSATVSPSGHDTIVYHAWAPASAESSSPNPPEAPSVGRTLRIDPLLWTDDGPRVDGPSTSLRTLP